MIYWVALNLIDGMKPTHRAALLRVFETPDQIFQMSEMDLVATGEIRAELAYRIAHFDMASAKQEIDAAQKAGMRIITLEDAEYPSLLKNIPDPPVVLYVAGSLVRDEPCVAMVGSRKPTAYGLNVAQSLSRNLASAGWTLVSGLARGVDAAAHSAALQTGGRTIAVLGSGLNVIYPSEHKNLSRKIMDQGAVITEFPLGTSPNRENFPIRNRIISGLSSGIVVVEASDRSGSLITARMAAEQGREIFAVPGSIFSESSKGCNSLLKDGAILVRDWEDVVAELPVRVAGAKVEDHAEETALSEMEQDIVNTLSFDEPKHVDHIAGRIGLSSQKILGALVNLELRSYITQMPGKHFLRLK